MYCWLPWGQHSPGLAQSVHNSMRRTRFHPASRKKVLQWEQNTPAASGEVTSSGQRWEWHIPVPRPAHLSHRRSPSLQSAYKISLIQLLLFKEQVARGGKLSPAHGKPGQAVTGPRQAFSSGSSSQARMKMMDEDDGGN